ncbi:ABC transporter ATP-binding protein [Croceicoccus naphthovorans]
MVQELADEGIGILWSTAYLDEAEKCETVFLLNEGRILASGPPQDLTDKIADRVLRYPVESDRRTVLRQALDNPAIIDGAVQGGSIRLLLAEGAEAPKPDAIDASGPSRKAIPRYEDAFIDLLGGGPGGSSELAQKYPHTPEHDRPAIEAKGLTKRFGDFTAAHDIRFTVPRGKVFGLLGPNGAGKSTTFKMLCGLLRPSEGTGAVDGYDLLTSGADARQSLGYMAQKFSLYGDLSVQQNLSFFAGAYGLGRAEAKAAVDDAIETFHLAQFLGSNAGMLPLGYKQRLALACAVLHRPPVLFLDEPTSGVDPIVRREFWNHINGLVERGVSVLVTTHFMDEAEYCDEIALIYRGEQIAIGSPDALKEDAGTGEASMEDAFIALIERSDAAREEREAA